MISGPCILEAVVSMADAACMTLSYLKQENRGETRLGDDKRVLQIPPAIIHDTLLPLLFRMLEHGVRAVMAPAASAMCALFRRLTRERHRTEVLIRIVRDFAHSPSSAHRLAFVHVARAALETFSASFFCAHLIMYLLPLASDSSLAVRNFLYMRTSIV